MRPVPYCHNWLFMHTDTHMHMQLGAHTCTQHIHTYTTCNTPNYTHTYTIHRYTDVRYVVIVSIAILDEVWLGCGERQGAKVCVIKCGEEKLKLEVPPTGVSNHLYTQLDCSCTSVMTNILASLKSFQ